MTPPPVVPPVTVVAIPGSFCQNGNVSNEAKQFVYKTVSSLQTGNREPKKNESRFVVTVYGNSVAKVLVDSMKLEVTTSRAILAALETADIPFNIGDGNVTLLLQLMASSNWTLGSNQSGVTSTETQSSRALVVLGSNVTVVDDSSTAPISSLRNNSWEVFTVGSDQTDVSQTHSLISIATQPISTHCIFSSSQQLSSAGLVVGSLLQTGQKVTNLKFCQLLAPFLVNLDVACSFRAARDL